MNFDMVIKNGRVLDGTGNPSLKADVGITNGRITKIGKIQDDSVKSINAQRLIVSPGFIDPHVHIGNYNDFENIDIHSVHSVLRMFVSCQSFLLNFSTALSISFSTSRSFLLFK